MDGSPDAQTFPQAPDLLPVQPGTPSVPGTTGQLLPGGLSDAAPTLSSLIESDLFLQIQSISTMVGIGFLVFVVVSTIKNIVASNIMGAVKIVFWGAIVAAMLFNLRLPVLFAEGLTGFITTVFRSLLDATA